MRTSIETEKSLRQAVARQYGQVAIQNTDNFPFPVGRKFAESLGYRSHVLDTLPVSTVKAFTGISNPLAFADLQPGETVLDVGCGAGVDTFLIARQVGSAGQVIGVDLAPEMVDSAQANAARQGLSQVDLLLAPAEELPLPNDMIDAAIVNGIFNLCPRKEVVAAEIWRVLKPRGRLIVSEIFLEMSDNETEDFQTCSLADAPAPKEALAKWFS